MDASPHAFVANSFTPAYPEWLRNGCSRPRKLALLVLAALFFVSNAASGQTIQFQVNTSASTLQLVPATFNGNLVASGTKLTNTIGIFQQKAQSLTTRLSGTLVGTLSSGVFTLSSQSTVVATENSVGPFPPDLSGMVDNFGALAKSNFGGTLETEATVAIRDIAARINSGTISIGSPANSVTVELTAGVINVLETSGNDYTQGVVSLLDPAVITSSQPVTGNFNTSITIPFTINYLFDNEGVSDGRVSLAGTLVATRLNPPASIPGDFTNNGVVDGADLTQWRGSFGVNGNSNADGDSDSDGNDFLIWQRNVGRTSATAAVGAVPEPAAVWLALAAAAGIAQRQLLRQRQFGRADGR